jgi:hypothetical protein
VTAGSAAGAAGVVALSGSGFDLSIGASALAATLAAAGWLAAVLATRHPVLAELRQAQRRLRQDVVRPTLLGSSRAQRLG